MSEEAEWAGVRRQDGAGRRNPRIQQGAVMRWLQLVYPGLLCASLIGHSFKARKKMPMETKTKDKEQAFQMSEAGIWPPGRSRGQQPGNLSPNQLSPLCPCSYSFPRSSAALSTPWTHLGDFLEGVWQIITQKESKRRRGKNKIISSA